MTKLDYPATRRVEQFDDYHGVKVADPYRWLEEADSPETQAWIATQNKLTFAYLERVPQRDSIRQRLTHLWDYEKTDTPHQDGGRYFFLRNNGLQNQSVLYVQDAPAAPPRVLLDPNTLSADGTVALSGYEVSNDGRLLAYGVSQAGSDWQEWRVRDVATALDLADHLQWVKFSAAAWDHDSRGFYYGRYDRPDEKTKLRAANYFQKLYYHQVGTPQDDDQLVYERPEQKEWGFGARVSEDGQYLTVTVWRGTDEKNGFFYHDLSEPKSGMVELLADFDASYVFVGNEGPVFWFRTDRGAPRGRVVAIDVRAPAPESWKEIVPESSETLVGVVLLHDRFVACYLKDAHSEVKVYRLDGSLERDIALSGPGTATGFRGRRKDRETFFTYTDFVTPPTVYHLDLTSYATSVYSQPQVDFNPSDYETKQAFYTSRDGTRVSLFIVHKKGLKLDGQRPTILYGYGGFNIALTPAFAVSSLVWMEMGGVYAVANLRGGGEYGETWHQAGTKLRKQNVFDDFHAAAEWLIANRYTGPGKLAISGGSNGGLLVGAAMTERPDLYAAAVAQVGVFDMLRYHKFTIGWAWIPDYGTSDDADEFKALYAYSPLHNLRPGTSYPATLITTGDHDDRVVPAHSFKFAAALQAAQGGTAPALIRVETRAGHGAGKPTSKVIDETTDRLAFLVKVLDMHPHFAEPVVDR